MMLWIYHNPIRKRVGVTGGYWRYVVLVSVDDSYNLHGGLLQ